MNPSQRPPASLSLLPIVMKAIWWRKKSEREQLLNGIWWFSSRAFVCFRFSFHRTNRKKSCFLSSNFPHDDNTSCFIHRLITEQAHNSFCSLALDFEVKTNISLFDALTRVVIKMQKKFLHFRRCRCKACALNEISPQTHFEHYLITLKSSQPLKRGRNFMPRVFEENEKHF